jgi:hypothetical protein
MTDDTPLPFDLPAVCRKKLTVDFNGGTQSSDGGLLLLRAAARTPKGTEVRTVIKHVTKLLKQHWPNSRVEAMEWIDSNLPRHRNSLVSCAWKTTGANRRPQILLTNLFFKGQVDVVEKPENPRLTHISRAAPT